MQGFPAYLPNPSPLTTWLTVGGVSAGLLLLGLGVAHASSRKGPAEPTSPEPRRPALPDRPDMPIFQSGMMRKYADACDIVAAGEEPFVEFMANVSVSTTDQWPPPRDRDPDVVVEAMRQAFPSCPWPPTDPNWRAHGDSPGEVVTWQRFLELMSNMFDEAYAGTLPWGPPAYASGPGGYTEDVFR